MNLITPDLHPSQYEMNDVMNVKQKRTLLTIKEEREKALSIDDLDKLKSPGQYHFTPNDTHLRGSNTTAVFRDLYGETLLTFLFFSKENIENIQKLIRMLVYKYTKESVDYQSNNELLVVMRSVFLSYSKHPPLLDDSMSDNKKKELRKQYTNEVDRLNQLVIDICVPNIVSQLQQYLLYLSDASSPLRVMEKPESTSVKGTKDYRSQTQVLLGGDL